MRTKNVVMMLAVVSLLLTMPVLAKKPAGELGPPTLSSISLTTATIDEVENVDVYYLLWTPVVGADKYSVDITAKVIYDTGEVDEYDDPILAEIEVQASFGTSERLDGGDMGDNDLNIPVSDVDALLAELDALLILMEIEPADIVELKVSAKVKALDPSVKPTKRQNNPFSNSLDLPMP